ncbi:MAG: DUF3445 domain-containing protein [Thalassobaculaceae bacterium]|nr:DUF3445 domain-containing protein [Thalassobaculaceae bacterium]
MTTSTTTSPRFAPYEKGRFQLTLGIRQIAMADWIDVDRHFAAHMAEKARLLAGRHGEVFAALPESRPAQQECLDVVLAHVVRRHPDIAVVDGEAVRTLWNGERLDRAAFSEAPLDLAGRLVQEDLCLMQPGEDGHRLIAASLCFPARWRLADKIGRPMAAIHDPVPGFNARLNRPVERFFAGIEEGQLYMRLNWSILDDPALFQPAGHGRKTVDPSITPELIAKRVHIRIERQTFRRLPKTGVLVFGIKTVVDPIAVIADRPDLAAAMLGSLRTMPDEMRGYKSLAPFAAALEAWLECSAAS